MSRRRFCGNRGAGTGKGLGGVAKNAFKIISPLYFFAFGRYNGRMKLYFLRKNPTETAAIAVLFAIGFFGLPYAEIGALFLKDALAAEIGGLLICRLVAAAFALTALIGLGLGGTLFPRGSGKEVLICAIPALCVAVNNLPIVALARGTAGVSASADLVALFALQCLFVAAFEELCFRGIVFPLLLQRFGAARKGRLAAAVVSSALFGALHFLNLLSGAPLGAVALQAGYSFLIGGMLAALLFSGGSVLLCALAHACYNFCGLIVPTLGFGEFHAVWNPPEIALTAAVGILVAVLIVWRFCRCRGDSAAELVRFSESAEELHARIRR